MGLFYETPCHDFSRHHRVGRRAIVDAAMNITVEDGREFVTF